MTDTDVWVYEYKYWDVKRGDLVVAKYVATLDAIRNGLGEPIITSGRPMPRSMLDLDGRVLVGQA